MSTYAAARLVAAREIRVKLRDKTFVFGTLFFLLFSVGVTVLPGLLNGGPASVAVADRGTAATLTAHGLDVRMVADDAAAERLVRAGEVDGAVLRGPEVIALDDEPGDVVDALSTAPPVRLLDPGAVDPFLAYIVPFGLAMVFFFTSFMFGLQIAQSVTEEKQTRIVEILVASVPTRALLGGKVAALTLLAFVQVALIAIVTLTGARLAGGNRGLLHALEPAVGWFVPFFVLGFLMLATLWAGVGALAGRVEDLNGVSQPVQMLVMLPFVAMVFLFDNDAAMRVMSFIPFTTPVAMPARIFAGETAWWEPAVALATLLATAVVLLAAGARVYEGSLLRTSGRTSWATAWRGATAG